MEKKTVCFFWLLVKGGGDEQVLWHRLKPPTSSKLSEVCPGGLRSSGKEQHLANLLRAGFGKYMILPETSSAVLPDSAIETRFLLSNHYGMKHLLDFWRME